MEEHLYRELQNMKFDGLCTRVPGGLCVSDGRNLAMFSNNGVLSGDSSLVELLETVRAAIRVKQLAVLRKTLPGILFQLNPLGLDWVKAKLILKS